MVKFRVNIWVIVRVRAFDRVSFSYWADAIARCRARARVRAGVRLGL
jgi:hypothetical protein